MVNSANTDTVRAVIFIAKVVSATVVVPSVWLTAFATVVVTSSCEMVLATVVVASDRGMVLSTVVVTLDRETVLATVVSAMVVAEVDVFSMVGVALVGTAANGKTT
jgi:hypothetical protein